MDDEQLAKRLHELEITRQQLAEEQARQDEKLARYT